MGAKDRAHIFRLRGAGVGGMDLVDPSAADPIPVLPEEVADVVVVIQLDNLVALTLLHGRDYGVYSLGVCHRVLRKDRPRRLVLVDLGRFDGCAHQVALNELG